MKPFSLSVFLAITAASVQAENVLSNLRGSEALRRQLEGDYLMEECCDKGHGNHDLAMACVSHKTDEYVRMKMMSHSQQMHTLENAMRWKCEVEAPPEHAAGAAQAAEAEAAAAERKPEGAGSQAEGAGSQAEGAGSQAEEHKPEDSGSQAEERKPEGTGTGAKPAGVEELKQMRDAALEKAAEAKKNMEKAMEEAADAQDEMEDADEEEKEKLKEKRDKALMKASEERKKKEKAMEEAEEYEEMMESAEEEEDY